jgi:hypothetical protein
MKKRIARFEMVELLINAAVTRQNFSDIPQLRSQKDQQIVIQKIQFFPLSIYANSQTTNATPGTPVAEVPKIVLTLYVRGEERIHFIPLAMLNNTQSDTGAGFTPFQQEQIEFDDLLEVDWTKSYVQYNAAAAGFPYIIPLGVTYLKSSLSGN